MDYFLAYQWLREIKSLRIAELSQVKLYLLLIHAEAEWQVVHKTLSRSLEIYLLQMCT